MVTSRQLSQIAWVDVPSKPLILVPVGSTEQHGPHLPFDTDTVIAVSAAEGIATVLADHDIEALVAPAIAYGASGEHQGFPGTMSIGHEALRVQVIELVRSLSNWAGRVIFINGHGGNVPTLASAVVQMRDEQHEVCWLACAFETTSDAHAGAAETSVMLHLAPSRVDMSRAAPGQLAPLADLMAALQSNGVRSVSESGVLGDPTAASSAHGAELMEWLIVDGAARIRLPRLDDRGHLVAPSVGVT